MMFVDILWEQTAAALSLQSVIRSYIVRKKVNKVSVCKTIAKDRFPSPTFSSILFSTPSLSPFPQRLAIHRQMGGAKRVYGDSDRAMDLYGERASTPGEDSEWDERYYTSSPEQSMFGGGGAGGRRAQDPTTLQVSPSQLRNPVPSNRPGSASGGSILYQDGRISKTLPSLAMASPNAQQMLGGGDGSGETRPARTADYGSAYSHPNHEAEAAAAPRGGRVLEHLRRLENNKNNANNRGPSAGSTLSKEEIEAARSARQRHGQQWMQQQQQQREEQAPSPSSLSSVTSQNRPARMGRQFMMQAGRAAGSETDTAPPAADSSMDEDDRQPQPPVPPSGAQDRPLRLKVKKKENWVSAEHVSPASTARAVSCLLSFRFFMVIFAVVLFFSWRKWSLILTPSLLVLLWLRLLPLAEHEPDEAAAERRGAQGARVAVVGARGDGRGRPGRRRGKLRGARPRPGPHAGARGALAQLVADAAPAAGGGGGAPRQGNLPLGVAGAREHPEPPERRPRARRVGGAHTCRRVLRQQRGRW